VTLPLSAARREAVKDGLAVSYQGERIELSLDAESTRSLV